MSVAKTALTAAALGATVYSRLAGKKMKKAGGAPVEGITEPAASTPGDVSGAQRQQRVAQWMVPVFTGSAVGGEFPGRRAAEAGFGATRCGCSCAPVPHPVRLTRRRAAA